MTITAVLAIVFWGGLAGAIYAYAAFPALLALWARLVDRPRLGETPLQTPIVTVIVPAYNEEQAIGGKIRNVLDSHYSESLLDVIVVSDASTDRTDAIARAFEPRGVRLLVQERRQGKTAGLNRAMAIARGEIVVFTDANADFPPDAIGNLARYFADPRVGLVSGYTRYVQDADGRVAEATNLHTSLERVIKRAESLAGCCVGADGAIFAMRRSLYRTLGDDEINDFVLPLHVIDRGARCVFAEDAFCSERPGKNLESEFRRQSRITNRTLRALWRNAHLLNPLRSGRFAFFLFSHKVMRFCVPAFLVAAAVALAGLAVAGGPYRLLAALAAVGAGLVALGGRLPTGSRLSRIHGIAAAFLTINVAALDGWRKFLTGQGDVTWQHDRYSTP